MARPGGGITAFETAASAVVRVAAAVANVGFRRAESPAKTVEFISVIVTFKKQKYLVFHMPQLLKKKVKNKRFQL